MAMLNNQRVIVGVRSLYQIICLWKLLKMVFPIYNPNCTFQWWPTKSLVDTSAEGILEYVNDLNLGVGDKMGSGYPEPTQPCWAVIPVRGGTCRKGSHDQPSWRIAWFTRLYRWYNYSHPQIDGQVNPSFSLMLFSFFPSIWRYNNVVRWAKYNISCYQCYIFQQTIEHIIIYIYIYIHHILNK